MLMYICVFAQVFVLRAVYQKKEWSKTFALIGRSLLMLTKVKILLSQDLIESKFLVCAIIFLLCFQESCISSLLKKFFAFA